MTKDPEYPKDFDVIWSGGPLLPPRDSRPLERDATPLKIHFQAPPYDDSSFSVKDLEEGEKFEEMEEVEVLEEKGS